MSQPSRGTGSEMRLPTLLSVIAGMVDVIGFLSLGLFTAHVTGNLVVIAALLVRGGPPRMALVLAVPVFIAAVGAVWLIARGSGRRGPALVRPLLSVQAFLLVCVWILSVAMSPTLEPQGLTAMVAAMIAVSAMACQFALLRLAVPGSPSTAVMTGNLTSSVLLLLDGSSGDPPLLEGPRGRWRRTLSLLVGFLAGCIAGALAVSLLGDWAWSLPALLAAAAVVIGE